MRDANNQVSRSMRCYDLLIRPFVLARVSYYLCLHLTVVTTCASLSFGSVRLPYWKPRYSTGTTWEQSKRFKVEHASEARVGHAQMSTALGGHSSVKQAIRGNEFVFRHTLVKLFLRIIYTYIYICVELS